jgi:hypothetical protein
MGVLVDRTMIFDVCVCICLSYLDSTGLAALL